MGSFKKIDLRRNLNKLFLRENGARTTKMFDSENG